MREIESFEDSWRRCVEFHGHECPGLAIGFRAARAGLELIEGWRAMDEEVVAVVENDACGVDAVQVLLGCTFGKGNLIHLDYGKQAFSFFERSSGRSARLSLRQGVISLGDRQRELMEKARGGRATEAERQELAEGRRRVMEAILSRPTEELFAQGEAQLKLPERALVQRSEVCPSCGEPTMPSKMVERGGQRLCRPCAERSS